MNDDVIVTTSVVIAELVHHAAHRDHPLAQVGDAEVLTVAVVADSFQNHPARALPVLQGMSYLSGRLSASRFNRWGGISRARPRRVAAAGSAGA